MLTLKVRRFWQSRQQVVVGLLLCFCVLGLVPAGYGQADYVNQLINQLNAQDWMARFKARMTLFNIKDPQAVEPLIALLKDTKVRADSTSDLERQNNQLTAAHALGEIRDPRAVDPLIAALGDAFFNLRVSAAEALGGIHDPRAVGPLVAALKDVDNRVRKAAAGALGEIGLPAVGPLVAALKDSNPDVRQSAAEALGRIKDHQAVDAMNAALKDADSHSQQIAAQGSTFTYLVPKYLNAVATLDPTVTRPFLSATCQGDLVTEIQAVQRSGWTYSAKNSIAMIRSETLDAESGEALVTVEIAFEGGSGGGIQWDGGGKVVLGKISNTDHAGVWLLDGFTVFTIPNSMLLRVSHTFHLVWEGGDWKIARIDPAPRTTGPGFRPW